MSISDEQFRAWCKSQDAEPVWTMELDYQDEDGGEPVTRTLLISNRTYRLGSGRYYAILGKDPEFDVQLGGDGHSIYSSSFGTAALVSRGGEFDWLLDAAIDGSQVRYRYGDVSWPVDDHRLIRAARSVSVQRADDETLEVQIQATDVLLNKSISGQSLIGGTGPNADKPRSFNFGQVRQVECALIDQSALLWSHSDTGENTIATEVRVRLEPVGFTDNGDGTITLDAPPPTSGVVTASILALPPDADPSDTDRIRISDLLDVAVGIRSGLIADGSYAGAHPTFTIGDFEDYPIGVNVTDTRNTADFLKDATKTGQFSWAINREGNFTYLRIRPNDIDSLPMVPFDIRKDDIDFKAGIELEHEAPGYYRIRARGNLNWKLTDDIAGDVLDSEEYATVTRKGLAFEQDDAVGDTYADRPELYDLTLVESPIIDTWISDEDDDTALSILTSWAEVERFNGLPWIERVKHSVGMEFYDKDLGDVANLIFDRFGYDAGELVQVIGIRLAESKIQFTLLRRRLSQPYPEGWERVTTSEDATTESSFIFDSVAPPIVVPPPPGPPTPPWNPGNNPGAGGYDWGSVNWLANQQLYWILDTFSGSTPLATRTMDSGLSWGADLYGENLAPLVVGGNVMTASSAFNGYPNFKYVPDQSQALPPMPHYWFQLTATINAGGELGFFAVDDPSNYYGLEYDLFDDSGTLAMATYVATSAGSSIIPNVATTAFTGAPAVLRVEVTDDRKLISVWVATHLLAQHYEDALPAHAYAGLFVDGGSGDFSVDTIEGGSLSIVSASYSTFTATDATDPTSGGYTAEQGGPWVVDSVFGQGNTFPTFGIYSNSLRRLTLAENGNADGGESLIRPTGVLAGSPTHFFVDFVARFDTSSIGYVALYENAVNPANTDFLCSIGTGVGPSGQEASYYDGSTHDVSFTPNDDQNYVVRFEINGTTCKFYIDGVLKATFTRSTQPVFPFGLDLYDPNSDGCAKVTYWKVRRP